MVPATKIRNEQKVVGGVEVGTCSYRHCSVSEAMKIEEKSFAAGCLPKRPFLQPVTLIIWLPPSPVHPVGTGLQCSWYLSTTQLLTAHSNCRQKPIWMVWTHSCVLKNAGLGKPILSPPRPQLCCASLSSRKSASSLTPHLLLSFFTFLWRRMALFMVCECLYVHIFL